MAFPLLFRESPPRTITVPSETIIEEPCKEVLLRDLFTRIFSNDSEQQSIRLELQIMFKNPYSRIQTTTRIKATSYKFDRKNNSIECLFDASRGQATLFTYNEKAIESNVSVLVTGYRKDACIIDRFGSYTLASSPSDYTISSSNHAFLAKLEPLSDEQIRSITSQNRRSNASDSEDSSARNSPDINDRLKNIFLLSRAKLVLSCK